MVWMHATCRVDAFVSMNHCTYHNVQDYQSPTSTSKAWDHTALFFSLLECVNHPKLM